MAEPIVCPNKECASHEANDPGHVTVELAVRGYKEWDPANGYGKLVINEMETEDIRCPWCGVSLNVTTDELDTQTTNQTASDQEVA